MRFPASCARVSERVACAGIFRPLTGRSDKVELTARGESRRGLRGGREKSVFLTSNFEVRSSWNGRHARLHLGLSHHYEAFPARHCRVAPLGWAFSRGSDAEWRSGIPRTVRWLPRPSHLPCPAKRRTEEVAGVAHSAGARFRRDDECRVSAAARRA